MQELRCSSKKHAEIDLKGQFIEIKCGSHFCGAAPGVVVIHQYSLVDGSYIMTKKFKDPMKGPQA